MWRWGGAAEGRRVCSARGGAEAAFESPSDEGRKWKSARRRSAHLLEWAWPVAAGMGTATKADRRRGW